jgi:hypothetical protein
VLDRRRSGRRGAPCPGPRRDGARPRGRGAPVPVVHPESTQGARRGFADTPVVEGGDLVAAYAQVLGEGSIEALGHSRSPCHDDLAASHGLRLEAAHREDVSVQGGNLHGLHRPIDVHPAPPEYAHPRPYCRTIVLVKEMELGVNP